MALSNGISGEFLPPVNTSGKQSPGEVTVNRTSGQWLVVEIVRVLYITCCVH